MVKARNSHVMFAAFVLLAMLPASYAATCALDTDCGSGKICRDGVCQACTPGSYEKNGVCVTDYLVNAANIALLISFLLVGVVYALAKVFEDARFSNWAQTHLYQTIGTAIILLFYLSASGFLDLALGPAFCSGSIVYPELGAPPGGARSCTDWTSTQAYVANYLEEKKAFAVASAISVLSLSDCAGLASSLSIGINVDVISMYWTPFGALGSLSNALGMMLSAIAAAVVFLQFQIAVIGMYPGLFGVLLPLGIVLRTFPFTRRAGGAMIAIAIGFTIILPLSYLVVKDIEDKYWNDNCATASTTADCWASAYDVGPTLASSILNPTASTLPTEVINKLKDLFQPGGKYSCLAFKLGIAGIILPLLAYMITLHITRGIAELLGTDLDLSALVKIL